MSESSFDSGILDSLRIRSDHYFGIDDWEKLAKELQVEISFNRTIQVPALRELDAIVSAKKGAVSFAEALMHGEAFAFMVPNFSTGVEYWMAGAGVDVRGVFQKIPTGFYVVHNECSRPRQLLKNIGDPLMILSAVLCSLKREDLPEDKRKVFFRIKKSNGAPCHEGNIPLCLLQGVLMPMERFQLASK